jgi:Protein of unknown function (DUF1501)
MFRFLTSNTRLCDGMSRREWLRVGSLGACGLTLPTLLQQRALPAAERSGSFGKAKSCIFFMLLGGPPQHESWDPKPQAPLEIRGDLQPISSAVPGIAVGECMPLSAKHTDKIAILRACRTADNAHSTSGYYMITGIPHLPKQIEGAAPGAPNHWPCLGGIIRSLKPSVGAFPSAVTLPEIAANDGNKTWPGQDAGFLGRACDPWLIEGDPAQAQFEIPNLAFTTDRPQTQFEQRFDLLHQMEQRKWLAERGGALERFNTWQHQALDLLRTPQARQAFDLSRETTATRERYGMNRFGQSVLLARRLVEAGVPLTQVNWTRIDNAPNNGSWDTHTKNSESCRNWLMPRVDQAYAALLEDLIERGLFDETLVVWTGEFGRTPKINPAGGRDHWGNVFSLALAGAGVKRGVVYGSSDRLGAEPATGLVLPEDVHATIYHSLGFDPATIMHDSTGRTHPISRGRVIHEVLS